jgi:hypothetical protein
MPATTEIHNQTSRRLTVSFQGVVQSTYDIITVDAYETYLMEVKRVYVPKTSHDYLCRVAFGDDSAKNLVLSSDDLCDNKSITFEEEAGQLRVHKESRSHGDPQHDGTTSSANRLWRWISSWAHGLMVSWSWSQGPTVSWSFQASS